MKERIRQELKRITLIDNKILFPDFFLYLLLLSAVPMPWKQLDNDNWFQLSHINVLLNEGFVKTDPLSMHEGMRFIIPQWLTALIIHTIYNHAGIVGLYIFFSAVYAVGILVIYKIARLYTTSRKALFVTWFISFVFINIYFSPRPHVISFVLLLLEIYCIELFYQKNTVTGLCFLPLLSAAFINLHNSIWVMQFIILLPYFAEEIIKIYTHPSYFKQSVKLRNLTVTGCLMAITGLLNPYGFSSIQYIFDSMKSISPASQYISELQPPTFYNNGISVVLTFLFITVILIRFGGIKKAPLRYYLLFTGTYIMSLLNIRNFLHFLIASIPILCLAVQNIPTKKADLKTSKSTLLYGIILMIMVGTIATLPQGTPVKCYTEEAVAFLDANYNKDVKIFNSMNSGPYLEYKGYKPYIDTRLEVFGKQNNKQYDYLTEYFDVTKMKTDPNEFLQKYNFDLVLMLKEQDTIMINALKYTPYKLIYDDDTVVIYKR